MYLSPQALALFAELRSLAGGSELVLPGRGSLTKPFAHNAMNSALKVALRGQDIPAFTIHDLRRTASTLLHEHGWPADVVEKALRRPPSSKQREIAHDGLVVRTAGTDDDAILRADTTAPLRPPLATAYESASKVT